MKPICGLFMLAVLTQGADAQQQPPTTAPSGAAQPSVRPLSQQRPDAWADMQNKDGKSLGTATLTKKTQGALLRVEVNGQTPGWHAIHIHGTGKCEATQGSPTFASAGGHFNPENHKHGFVADGHHVGDLPNVFADNTGAIRAELLATKVTFDGGPKGLFGPNGTAIVIHAGPDDYRTDPAGASGDRVVCGVIEK